MPLSGQMFYNYSRARLARPTAPIAHDATFTLAAAPGVAAGAAPLPDALGLWPLWSSLEVPLGKPEMFCCEISMPVLFLQWLATSDCEREAERRVTSVHYRYQLAKLSTRDYSFRPVLG